MLLENYFDSYNPDNVWEVGPNLDCRKSVHNKTTKLLLLLLFDRRAEVPSYRFGTTDHDKCVILSLTKSMVYVLLKFDSISFSSGGTGCAASTGEFYLGKRQGRPHRWGIICKLGLEVFLKVLQSYMFQAPQSVALTTLK